MWALLFLVFTATVLHRCNGGACPLLVHKYSHWSNDIIPTTDLAAIPVPITQVRIYSTGTDNCDSKKECIEMLKEFLEQRKKKGQDLGFNYFVGGDGTIFQGRGFRTKKGPGDALEIAFVGTFKGVQPSAVQIKAFKGFIKCAINNGWIHEEYELMAFKGPNKNPPGKFLLQELKKMASFVSKKDYGANANNEKTD